MRCRGTRHRENTTSDEFVFLLGNLFTCEVFLEADELLGLTVFRHEKYTS